MDNTDTGKSTEKSSLLYDFTAIYKRYHKPVYLNIKKIINDEDEALDILQEVFEKLWDRKHLISGLDEIGGWLFTVSYNQSISHLRKRVYHVSFTDELSETVLANEMLECEEETQTKLKVIKEAVDCLPARKKEIFILDRYEGKTREQISEITGLSKDLIREYLNQSNKYIQRYIGIKYPHLIQSAFITFIIYN